MVNMRALIGVLSVFGGCQLNIMALEVIMKHPSGPELGNVLTFLQFVAVALMAFPMMLDHDAAQKNGAFSRYSILTSLRPHQLSYRLLASLASMFYVVSLLNNVVFKFNISVPLHAVFRSASLTVSILLGFFFRGLRYSAGHITCCILVTVGIVFLTIETSKMKDLTRSSPTTVHNNNATSTTCGSAATGGCGGIPATTAILNQDAFTPMAWWLIGIAVLIFTTGAGAGLGVIQDAMYAEARTRLPPATASELWRGALFWSHVLPIPVFLLMGFVSDDPLFGGALFKQLRRVPTDLQLPLLVNVVSQFVCIRGVYTLVASTSALTMTLVITLRKFMSICISVYTFGHYAHFNVVHYASLAAVIVGGTIYPLLSPPTKAKQD